MWNNEEEQHSKELRKNETLQYRLSNSPQEDEDDGPPPGFDSIPVNLSTDKNKEPEQNYDDDDDGPPPGFQPISLKEYKETKKFESFEEYDDDDDGPPPGFHSVHAIKQDDDVSLPISHSIPVIEPQKGNGLNPNSQSGSKIFGNVSELGFQSIPVMKEEKSGDGFELGLQPASIEESEKGLQSVFNVKEDEKMGDGSELGFESVTNKEEEKEGDESELGSRPLPMIEDENEGRISEKEVGEDDDDEGPPPGWGSCPPPRQPIKSSTPHHQPPPAVPSGNAPEPTHAKEGENVGDEFDAGSQSVPMEEDGKERRDGSELDSQSFAVKVEEKGSSPVKEDNEDKDGDDEGPPPGWDSFRPPRMPSEAPSPPQLPPLTPVPTRPSATASGKAQMVCGSCRTLLSYSKGARFVQCSSCQTVNLVLEEHQVGQVKCRGCTVLLMYPYGAPSVQCSSCLFVTKIGVQNKRPPLSMQQGRPQMSANPVH